MSLALLSKTPIVNRPILAAYPGVILSGIKTRRHRRTGMCITNQSVADKSVDGVDLQVVYQRIASFVSSQRQKIRQEKGFDEQPDRKCT